MNAIPFLGLCVLCLAGIAYVIGMSTGTRNERTAGNVGCAFDWTWGVIAAVVVVVLMLATVEALTTGQSFENPVSLVGTEYEQVWETFWAGVFGLE